jgi:hypothetical protein
MPCHPQYSTNLLLEPPTDFSLVNETHHFDELARHLLKLSQGVVFCLIRYKSSGIFVLFYFEMKPILLFFLSKSEDMLGGSICLYDIVYSLFVTAASDKCCRDLFMLML